METEHLDAEVVAAYLGGLIDDDQRERVETHLAECSLCCEELAAIDETLRTMPHRGGWRWLGPVAAAAAVLAGLLVVQPWAEGPVQPGDPREVVERASPGVTSSAIQILGPAPDAHVSPEELVLYWRSVGPGARYEVTLTTVAGDSVWALLTSDTTASLPSETRLDQGREYLWYVDALLPDGRTASTGIARFRTVP